MEENYGGVGLLQTADLMVMQTKIALGFFFHEGYKIPAQKQVHNKKLAISAFCFNIMSATVDTSLSLIHISASSIYF